MRDALRRPGTLAAASTTAFVSLVLATTVDSSTGGGVSVVADVTLALAAALLGGLWFDLPRGQEADTARSIRQLLGLSTVSLIVFAGLYLVAQRSAFGQRFERDVLLGRGAGAAGLQGGASAILDQVTAGAVALLAGAVCCVAVVRGRLGLASATGVAVVLTLASAAVLKSLLLARPVLLGSDAVATVRSYPSGHVAAATALGCAAVVVAPAGWRLRAAGVAVALTGVVGVAVLFAGWHRPSDAIGGVATAMCWFGVVAAILVRSQRRPSWRGSVPGSRIPPRVWLVGAYLLAIGAVCFALVELVRLQARLDTPRHVAAFLAGSLLFLAIDVLAFAALAAALPRDPTGGQAAAGDARQLTRPDHHDPAR